MHGPLAFLLFWLVALAVGTALVLAVLGGGIGWLAVVAVSALALLPVVLRRRRRRD
jgi:membrane protein implicated in regulation of membrane protease activity